MKSIRWYIVKTISKISRNHEILVDYYRRRGVRIGKGCLVCTDLSLGCDSELLVIGDNVVISTNVNFVLHDFSISRVISGKSNLYGKVVIGNNCFIGAGSTLMYGVTLTDNVIVAAGSVVTKSFLEKDIIIGGNPAKKIGTWDEFQNKYKKNATSVDQDINDVLKRQEMLVKK